MEEFSLEGVDIDEDDDPEDCDGGARNIIRVIVCMTPVNSQRLLRANLLKVTLPSSVSLAFLSSRSVDWRMVLGLVSTLFILLFFYH